MIRICYVNIPCIKMSINAQPCACTPHTKKFFERLAEEVTEDVNVNKIQANIWQVKSRIASRTQRAEKLTDSIR